RKNIPEFADSTAHVADRSSTEFADLVEGDSVALRLPDPRESDSRTDVNSVWRMICPQPECGLHGRIELRRRHVMIGLEACTVHHLKGGRLAPEIAERDVSVPDGAVERRRIECARETRRLIAGKFPERVERKRSEGIRIRLLADPVDARIGV